MIRFDQIYVQDGQICGSVILDNEPIGEFRVSVPQWDALRQHETDDILTVMNEDQVQTYREEQAHEASLA